jgi:MOSC domain-containing protein YiiM
MISAMKILSVNVGLPRKIVLDGKSVTTGIYKSPVHGRVRVTRLNIEGDRQADLSVHGGPNKAVYAYPSEHYAYWQREILDIEMPWGMFGENLTLNGLLEDDAHIGDRFRMGTAVLMVTQPRLPCYKLGIRFGLEDMPDRFLESGRTGFYFAVIDEGELGEGDAVQPIHRDANRVSVSDVLRLCYGDGRQDAQFLQRALNIEALPPGWRKRLLERLGYRMGGEQSS